MSGDALRDHPMTTASEATKAMRGTKRVCQACEVRFYDLLREPIVCPCCGAPHTPVVRPMIETGTRSAPGGKTGWRHSAKRAGPVLPRPDPERPVPPEAAASDDIEGTSEEVRDVVPDDNIVPEQEPDDADVSGLVDLDSEERKDV